MVTLIGGEGRYLDVNDAFLERLGFTREEMIGHRPAEFVTESSARRIESEFLPPLRRTGKLENKPVALRTKSGDVVDCLTNSLVEHDPDGSFVRIVAIYSEVADQAKANLKYRQLYRSTPAMLQTVDANGCIMAVTDHWLQKMAYTRDEVVGRQIVDFFSHRYRRKFAGDRLQEVIDGGEFNNEERQMVTKDGIVLDLLMSATSERDSSGRVQRMLVASKDVTERRRAERELRRTLGENARLREELERERDYLREEIHVAMNFGQIVGKSEALRRMMKRVEAVAETPANVLIQGESGVGKELVAHAIHVHSSRRDGPLVKVNCASIPKELFESEFFGHVKGAFTGAVKNKEGLFEVADGGTLFLDEIGDMPLSLQAKLLRVLQERRVRPVGSNNVLPIDTRVISATNHDLESAMGDGRFREDLYYRLNVLELRMPNLSERREDIPALVAHKLEELARDAGTNRRFSPGAMELLVSAEWPGNVRQLFNLVEKTAALAASPLISVRQVKQALGDQSAALRPFAEAREDFTRGYLIELMRLSQGNVSKAARMAKRNRTDFYRLLSKHRLDAADFKA